MLCEYEKRWAGPWVEEYMLLGARSTQRIEGAHTALKDILGKAGRMLHWFKSFHKYLCSSVSIIIKRFGYRKSC
ncbi:hypothetical protein BDB00DRAFT_576742 [Zychaea mexicana]|uniref:uncharacterized protein n=1 Tax=Zychaea mexicana TaxID=64656 RepID=UPI0022FE3023|nr:uncharacterized protein BDB00DRAFT_576742 [Zychaea mexicana]KAI9489993.1 hypothetical protein BDB00DRAFT_576742 [Zychaea mexicana]